MPSRLAYSFTTCQTTFSVTSVPQTVPFRQTHLKSFPCLISAALNQWSRVLIAQVDADLRPVASVSENVNCTVRNTMATGTAILLACRLLSVSSTGGGADVVRRVKLRQERSIYTFEERKWIFGTNELLQAEALAPSIPQLITHKLIRRRTWPSGI